MSHRFFVPPANIADGAVRFSPEQARQMVHVLRLRSGEEVLALDGSGMEYTVRLGMTGAEVWGSLTGSAPARGEPRTIVRLWQALLKGDRWEWVLQKGTELGISSFVPVVTERAVARYDRTGWLQRARRWHRVLQEAAEQCGRGRVPELREPVSWAEACRAAEGAGLLLYEGERETSLRDALSARADRAVDLLAGPEGGFSDAEVRLARDAGLRTVTLGPRTLRAETAGPVAAALVLYELEGGGATPYPCSPA